MADTKTSALSAAAALNGTEKIYVSQGATDKYMTPAQLKAYCNALVNIGIMFWPINQMPGLPLSTTFGANTIVFDSITDRLAYVGRSPITDSISKIYFRMGTVTTGDTVDVRIESVSGGRPTGTLIDSGTTNNAHVTVAIADTDDNVWKTATLGTAAALTAGQEFAIVIVHSSGATPNEIFISAPAAITGYAGHYPLMLQDVGGGTWAGILATWEWVVEMTTAGVVAISGLSPLNGAGTITAYNNTTNPNERAMKFVAPMKCRVIGLRVGMFNTAAGADFTFSIWDSTDNPAANPTPLAQVAESGNYALSTTQDGLVDMIFPAPLTLVAGATYYAGVRPDTANNIGLGEMSAAGTGAAVNAIRAFGIGSNLACLSTRQWVGTDPGAWTDTTTTLPMISLIIDSVVI